ncbi:hypothetical protein BD626DRAFT_513874 [Schizophyllum amplum]|uniref:Uncharacterized protein n=1 Tax=Schizophyllum amplum TaxID=97359 RepID=A0A550BYU7_9AGAR|nr:hypothetical protein BD626DRAFT_513874 [Auriculariopsis ampla]
MIDEFPCNVPSANTSTRPLQVDIMLPAQVGGLMREHGATRIHALIRARSSSRLRARCIPFTIHAASRRLRRGRDSSGLRLSIVRTLVLKTLLLHVVVLDGVKNITAKGVKSATSRNDGADDSDFARRLLSRSTTSSPCGRRCWWTLASRARGTWRNFEGGRRRACARYWSRRSCP